MYFWASFKVISGCFSVLFSKKIPPILLGLVPPNKNPGYMAEVSSTTDAIGYTGDDHWMSMAKFKKIHWLHLLSLWFFCFSHRYLEDILLMTPLAPFDPVVL